jgi:chromosome partitioning protein
MVPSNVKLAAAERELVGTVEGQQRLRVRLSELDGLDRYDYLVIDAPPSLGLLTINALAAADEVLIPVPSSIFALKDRSSWRRRSKWCAASSPVLGCISAVCC